MLLDVTLDELDQLFSFHDYVIAVHGLVVEHNWGLEG